MVQYLVAQIKKAMADAQSGNTITYATGKARGFPTICVVNTMLLLNLEPVLVLRFAFFLCLFFISSPQLFQDTAFRTGMRSISNVKCFYFPR